MGSSQALGNFQPVAIRYVYNIPFSSYPQRYYLFMLGDKWYWTYEVDGESQYGNEGQGFNDPVSCAEDCWIDMKRRDLE